MFEAGQSVIVTYPRYRDLITQLFLPKLDDIDVTNMLFQQDCVTCHTSRETIHC